MTGKSPKEEQKHSSAPKANSTVIAGNRTLQQDLGKWQERISAILHKENISEHDYFSSISSLTKSHGKTTPSTEIRYISEGISWGVITPLVLIGLFLVIVASCLYWQSWKEKRRMRDFLSQQRIPDIPYERSSEGRLSIRSTASQRSRGSSTCERPTSAPLRRQGSRYYRTEEEARKVPTLPRPLSPIDEVGHHRSVDTLITSVEDSVRPMSSNLQASWGTPKTSGTESRLGVLKGYENPCFSAPGKLTGNVYCEECNAMSSPYFPNNNTPTTEYEVDSDKSVLIIKNDEPGGHVINTESYPLHVYRHGQTQPPPLNCEEISSITTYPESIPPPYMSGPVQSSSTSVSSSGTVSLPSSISRFHASRTQNTPNYPFASTRNCSPLRLNFTLSSSIEISDHYSDNTSMLPCVGSSSTSNSTQATSRTNFPASVNSDEIQHYPAELKTKSASAPETRTPSLELMPNYKSYSVDVDLFRSISITETSPGARSQLSTSISCSMSQGVLHNPTPVSPRAEWDTVSSADKGTSLLDENHNVQGFDLASLPSRKVKFTVPVLDKKQYWV